MTTTRFTCIVMINFCLNLVLIRLIYRWQAWRRRMAYRALCRDSRVICQQVRRLQEELAREEVLS